MKLPLDKLKYLKVLIPGIIASLIAMFLYILIVEFVWPWWYFREAKECYLRGRDAYFKCEFDKAENLLRTALEKRHNYAPAHAALAQLYAVWADYSYQLAKPYREDYSALAIYHGMKAIQKEPNSLEGIRALTYAFACPRVLDYEKAKKLYGEAIVKGPHDPELAYVHWVIEGKKVICEEDRKPIREAIESKKDFLYARIDYARQLSKYDRSKEDLTDLALKILDETLEASSRIALAHLTRGVIYGDRFEVDKAEKSILEAIDCDDKGASSYCNLGIVYRLRGDFKKAIWYFERAKEISLNRFEPFVNLGLTYLELGKFNEAKQVIEQGIKITPHPQLHAALALVCYKIGLEEVAKYFLNKAISQDKRYLTFAWLPSTQVIALNAAKELSEKWDKWKYRGIY